MSDVKLRAWRAHKQGLDGPLDETSPADVLAASFVPPDDALRDAVERTAAFVRDELGDARGTSLDNTASRRPKLAALRALR